MRAIKCYFIYPLWWSIQTDDTNLSRSNEKRINQQKYTWKADFTILIQYYWINSFDIPIRCFVGTQSQIHSHSFKNLKRSQTKLYWMDYYSAAGPISEGGNTGGFSLMDLFLFWLALLCFVHTITLSYCFFIRFLLHELLVFNYSANCQSMMCQFKIHYKLFC